MSMLSILKLKYVIYFIYPRVENATKFMYCFKSYL